MNCFISDQDHSFAASSLCFFSNSFWFFSKILVDSARHFSNVFRKTSMCSLECWGIRFTRSLASPRVTTGNSMPLTWIPEYSDAYLRPSSSSTQACRRSRCPLSRARWGRGCRRWCGPWRPASPSCSGSSPSPAFSSAFRAPI